MYLEKMQSKHPPSWDETLREVQVVLTRSLGLGLHNCWGCKLYSHSTEQKIVYDVVVNHIIYKSKTEYDHVDQNNDIPEWVWYHC